MDSKWTSAKVGAALRSLREARGESAGDVARTCGVSTGYLEDIEEGSATPTIATLQRIANRVGTTLLDIVKAPPVEVTPPQTLEHVGSAILSLPVSGSKLDAAIAAVVREAMRRTEDNQSAAARLVGMERKAFVRRLAKANRQSNAQA